MFNAHVDYSFDVIVVQGLDHGFALLAVFYKTRIFQHAELMGYG